MNLLARRVAAISSMLDPIVTTLSCSSNDFPRHYTTIPEKQLSMAPSLPTSGALRSNIHVINLAICYNVHLHTMFLTIIVVIFRIVLTSTVVDLHASGMFPMEDGRIRSRRIWARLWA